jgi:peptidyl-tRNA hydrolase, PTH1 family
MPAPVTLIAGLGNPGSQYEHTLHNAGFWFVDALVSKFGGDISYNKKFDAAIGRTRIGGEDIWLVKPQGFMNLSGQPVRGMLDYYRLEVDGLLVAHDEIDLPPGTVRLKKGGGHGGHNGLRDVIRHCGSDFLRLRVGVGHPGDKSEVTGYVLKRGAPEVEAAIARNIDEAVAVMPVLLDKGPEAAMKELHTNKTD